MENPTLLNKMGARYRFSDQKIDRQVGLWETLLRHFNLQEEISAFKILGNVQPIQLGCEIHKQQYVDEEQQQ